MAFFEKYFKKIKNLFPILRLIIPKIDKMRYNYGLQHRNLVKIYSDILSLPKKEREMLKNWKNPNLNMSDIPVKIK